MNDIIENIPIEKVRTQMKIFISHASKNKEIILKFADFLESISTEIEVFCTSEKGCIAAGKNFIETIFEELNTSDLFIPVLSKEYYESKFCMIELGVAYSYMYSKHKKNGEYIFPFALYPINKGQALSGTPLSDIQVGDINSEVDVKAFLEYLSNERRISFGSGINKKLHLFESEINTRGLKKVNILEQAKIGTYFDDSIFFRNKEDVVNHIAKNDLITVNFNMNPYGERIIKYPNFISMVLGYADKLNLGQYLEFNSLAAFKFTLLNLTGSLKKITMEFKYSDSNRILEAFELPVVQGENKLSIPLAKMRSKALYKISEVCFVIHPEDVVETAGTFEIQEIEII